jgi:hypothetical protein
VDFIPLPTGWHNYYYYENMGKNGERQVVRTPCPGVLKVEFVYTEDNGEESSGGFEFRSADFCGGTVAEASGANFLGTFYGEDGWAEASSISANEQLSAHIISPS